MTANPSPMSFISDEELGEIHEWAFSGEMPAKCRCLLQVLLAAYREQVRQVKALKRQETERRAEEELTAIEKANPDDV